MFLQDVFHSTAVGEAFAPGTISTDTATKGEIIDTSEFHALLIIVTSLTITDGDYVLSVEESDVAAMTSGVTAVSAEETHGSGTAFALADDDTTKRIGSSGKKRYQRLVITSTSTSTGGVFSAVFVKANPRHGVTADD